ALSISRGDKLLIFYTGKALIAYRRALSMARNDVDRTLARRAVEHYLDWLIAVAREQPLRRNIAVVLWALGGEENDDEDTAILDDGVPVDTRIVDELLAAYRGDAPVDRMTYSADDHTIAYYESPQLMTDVSLTDFTRADQPK